MRDSEIKALEVELFVEALRQRHEYDFSQYARASLRRRVQVLADEEKVEHISDLISKVLYDDFFLQEVLAHLSIQVSEFYRNPYFFKRLREEIIPKLKTYPAVNIWIAGCANGEEAYSMAILAKEEGLESVHIYATDIHSDAIRKAEEGIYPKKNLEIYQSNYLKSGGKGKFDDYYQSSYDYIQIDKTLKDKILFSEHNLTVDNVFCEANLILCRNVLIYFNPKLQNNVIKLFNESLVRDGYLCLGSKEDLNFLDEKKSFKSIANIEKIYQKISIL